MDEANEHLKVRGYVTIMNGRTNQEMHIGRAFFDELHQHPKAFDVSASAGIVSQPWLIVHGADDETVPLSEAHSLLDSANTGPQGGENVKMLPLMVLVIPLAQGTRSRRHNLSYSKHLQRHRDIF